MQNGVILGGLGRSVELEGGLVNFDGVLSLCG